MLSACVGSAVVAAGIGPAEAGPTRAALDSPACAAPRARSALTVLPVGDRRTSLRGDLLTAPVEGVPSSRVAVATRVGDPNPPAAGFVQAARARLAGRTA